MKTCRLCFVLAAFVSVMLISSTSALAQPCYSGFTYRLPIEIDNSKSAKLVDFEVEVKVNTSALVSSGKMRSLGQDIRFLDGNGNELNYWITDGTMNSTSTSIWVRTDSISDYSKDTIYMYYGNSTSSAKSNQNATFQLVEEFNGSTLSSSKWNTCGSGTVALSGGKLKLTSNSTTASIYTKSRIDGPLIVELQGVTSSGGTAVVGQVNNSEKGYAMVHNGTTMQLATLTAGTSCIATSGYGSTNSTGIAGDWTFVWSGVSQNATWAGQTLSSSNSGTSMSNQSRINIANTGSFGTLEIDHVRIRKYASIVPTTSIGSEQNLNFTLTASYASPLCAGGDLQLTVNSVTGAIYAWKGPNGFKSSLQNPQITGVSTTDAGRYDLTVEIPTGCASKSTSVNVNISPRAVGGSVSGTQTVCSGSNTGVISLSGHTGNVVRWDSSSSASGPWNAIANTSLNQTYNNLATVIGDVRLGSKSSVWYGAVLRGDSDSIEIGDESNIQDNAVIHVDPGYPVKIGKACIVGHLALVHGATIENNVLVGMHSTILNGAQIGAFSIIGANALVTANTVIPPNSLVIGSPAKVVKQLTEKQLTHIKKNAEAYVNLSRAYLESELSD